MAVFHRKRYNHPWKIVRALKERPSFFGSKCFTNALTPRHGNLRKIPNFEVYVIGGLSARGWSYAMVGALWPARAPRRGFIFDIAFLGANGLFLGVWGYYSLFGGSGHRSRGSAESPPRSNCSRSYQVLDSLLTVALPIYPKYT